MRMQLSTLQTFINMKTNEPSAFLWQSQYQHACKLDQQVFHSSNEHEITSWHLNSASFWTPKGVSKSDTWKFKMSISDAPNLARTCTFSYMLNWTGLSVITNSVRKNLSRRSDRTRCSSSIPGPVDAEDEIDVGHRAIKRGELRSNPRLFGSGPLGNRSTPTGGFKLMPVWIINLL